MGRGMRKLMPFAENLEHVVRPGESLIRGTIRQMVAMSLPTPRV